MKDFILSALPFIVIGITIAIVTAYSDKKRKNSIKR